MLRRPEGYARNLRICTSYHLLASLLTNGLSASTRITHGIAGPHGDKQKKNQGEMACLGCLFLPPRVCSSLSMIHSTPAVLRRSEVLRAGRMYHTEPARYGLHSPADTLTSFHLGVVHSSCVLSAHPVLLSRTRSAQKEHCIHKTRRDAHIRRRLFTSRRIMLPRGIVRGIDADHLPPTLEAWGLNPRPPCAHGLFRHDAFVVARRGLFPRPEVRSTSLGNQGRRCNQRRIHRVQSAGLSGACIADNGLSEALSIALLCP
jgi:hypothetical protein